MEWFKGEGGWSAKSVSIYLLTYLPTYLPVYPSIHLSTCKSRKELVLKGFQPEKKPSVYVCAHILIKWYRPLLCDVVG